MCFLKDFIIVFSLNTPIKVIIENEVIIYGRRYKGADRDNTFDAFSIEELLNKYGDYVVDYSYIRDNILCIGIDER